MNHRGPSDWLAQNTYVVAGGLAVLCIVAVGVIASYDQLRGTDRWCYRWLDAEGSSQTTCRDNRRSCDFDRQRRCDDELGAAISSCQPQRDAGEAKLERCGP